MRKSGLSCGSTWGAFVAVAFALGASALGVGCDKKDAPSDAPAATTSAPVVATTPPAPTPMPTPSAMVSAAPAASDAPAAPGDLEMKIDKVKVSKGKVDRAEKKMKSNLKVLEAQCFAPALKKDASAIDGSLKMACELDGDGKIKKTTLTPTGKVPDDLQACIKRVVEKKLSGEFDTEGSTPVLEVTYTFGPKGAAAAGSAAPAASGKP